MSLWWWTVWNILFTGVNIFIEELGNVINKSVHRKHLVRNKQIEYYTEHHKFGQIFVKKDLLKTKQKGELGMLLSSC